MSFTTVVLSFFIAAGILCAVLYGYLRREQRKFSPQKDDIYSDPIVASTKNLSLPLIVGLIVIGLHFAISYLVDMTSYASQMEFTLGAPGFILSFFIRTSLVPDFVFRLFSSCVYGCIGALWATGKSGMKFIGVMLIGALIFMALLLSIVAYMFSA